MSTSRPCELPPCPPCPAATPKPCPQVCPPPPPMPPCRVKPVMRGLHMAQTKACLIQAISLSAICGASFYFLVSAPRIAAYKDYYLKAEVEDYADEMARKGLFQSVPPESLRDSELLEKKK